MELDLKTNSISSDAYAKGITDRGLFNLIIKKGGIPYVELQPDSKSDSLCNKTYELRNTGRHFGNAVSNTETAEVWKIHKRITDTSSNYRRHYINLDLWSRINSNSGSSLPKQINRITTEDIKSSDSNTIESYVTDSRSVRKCILTIFGACSKYSGWDIGIFKNYQKRTYSCQPIGLSVRQLSKNTHAGTDTLGRKNDVQVQNRVISQLRDIFRKPTSRKIIGLNPCQIFNDTKLRNMLERPELIFHRFQATYDSILDECFEKSRVVWCIPYLIVSMENVFFGKMIQSIKDKMLLSFESVYPIGLTNYQTGQRSVRTLREKFRVIGSGRYKIYSLDFSKFDSTIPMWSKDLFFATVRRSLDLTPKQEMVFDFLRFYVKYTPFIYGEKVYFKRKGISSGLLITNLFDTWWNLTIHYFVKIVLDFYPENIDEIFSENKFFDTLYMDPSKVKDHFNVERPMVRVMGDDSIILCDEHTLNLHRHVCNLLGMKVTVKHVTHHPEDDIFFLGRFWNDRDRPFQTEEYMALRIVYCKWYTKKAIKEMPFSLKDLHLNRMLSICLPLVGGKEFLDKYLYDYPPYLEFSKSKKGFTYMKDFIEDNFRYVDYNNAQSVDSF